ncbi:InlB B-repeat-containing protein [Dokdonella fugitiva]|uniref:InlB B-repeat-containing protein n=1 Tax=Dokdonella fugitiva TaxID=328517 RepID=UPI0015FD3CDA|nr:hypothetical protein [Dokdonella fugitiva]MBA8885761.1 hypothetical protein [Dokdonella fugitiva]
MTAFRHPRVLVDRARTATIRAAQALVVLLAMVLAVCAPVQAGVPDGLAAKDWQAIQAQLPIRPMGWDTSGGALQQGKLTAGDAQTGDYLGYSVAVSGDTAVVGAHYEDTGGFNAGAAYVFVRSGGSWSQQAKLVAGDPQANDYFGYSVALDGDTVLIGAYGKSIGAGAAYVFVRSGGNWIQQDKLVAADAEAYDGFGYSVALEGDTALVGARFEATGGTEAGAAYVFVRGSGNWSQQAKLVAVDAEAYDWFGWSVALDGDTALVGAPYEGDGGSAAGAAYVYVRSGGSWSQQAKLVAGDAQAGDQFGLSVALDGDTALVGAYGESAFAGAAYVYVHSGGIWSQQAKLVAGDAQAGDWFGWSVALDGDTVLVGAPYEDDGGTEAGAAYVYVRGGVNWIQQAKLVAGDPQAYDVFGLSVALDGDTVLVGAYGEDDGGADTGAAYVFVPVYAVQAAVSGLAGTGLVLRNNGGDDLAIAADGSHAFATLLADGSAYAVTVATQPTNPPQTCTVSGGDNDDGSGTMAGAPVTVSVTCATVSYTVTATATGNGTITPASQSVDHGDTATITVTPAVGHHVVSVTGDTCTPADNGDGTWTAPNITADCAVTATFAINAYTVTATATGNGTITPASQSVDHGDTAMLTVTPAVGHHVDTIGGTCPSGTLTGTSYQTGAITGDCSVTVAFAPDAPAVYVVTASASGNGTIAPASQSVTHGSAATFTMTPDAGHHVDTISGTCPAGTLTGSSYQTGAITGDCSVTVAFAPDAPAVYVVTANATGNGTIAPASQSVTHGSAATFTVTPDAGHHVDTIGGTCPAGTLTGTSYQTGPITGDCSVEVAFAVTVAATATPVPVDARWALLLLAALLAAAGLRRRRAMG